MKAYARRVAGLFFLWCILCIPFLLVPEQRAVTSFLFGFPVRQMGKLIRGQTIIVDFSSDTVSLILLIPLLLFVACVTALFKKSGALLLNRLCSTVIVYYLALVLLKYGLDKVFCRQFYSPAPNILFTPFGNLDKDILYWSTIGTSPAYSIATGVIEATAALLLLFRQTRFAGMLVAVVSLMHIVLINFAFDISVKCFSLLLLAMVIYVSGHQFIALFQFISGARRERLPVPAPMSSIIPSGLWAGLKCFAIGAILLFGFLPQFEEVPKPKLLGAYQVERYEVRGVAADTGVLPIKRFFVHPAFYLILQKADDTMTDYYFTENPAQEVINIVDYNGRRQKVCYEKGNGVLTMRFASGITISGRPLPWKNMSALQNGLHLTVDSVH